MESKRKNVYIVLFVITTIIAGCLAVYFGIMRNKDAKEYESQLAKLEEQADSTVDTNKNTMSDEDLVKKFNNIGYYVQTDLMENFEGEVRYQRKDRIWAELCYVSVSYNSDQDAEIVFRKR